MGTVRLNITLNEELEKKFRDTVAQSLGFKKGNLQIAIEEALQEWIQQKVQEKVREKKTRQ